MHPTHLDTIKEFASMFQRDICRLLTVAAVLLASVLVLVPAGALAQAPESAEGRLLTLRDCVRIAMESSANLRIRQAEYEIADDNVQESWGAFLPDLSFNGSYGKTDRTDYDSEQPIYGTYDQGFETVGGDSVYIPTPYQVGTTTSDVDVHAKSKGFGAAANLNLFDGLANINQLKSSKAYREAALLNEGYTREEVIQRVAVAYYNVLRYTQLQEVAEETRDEAAALLERTETYFRLGSAAKSEVLQQRVRLEQTRYDLVVAENAVEMAVADLAFAMNQPLAARVEIDTSPLQTEMVLEDVNVLYSEALGNRLDLQSSQYSVEAAEHSASAASGNFWPRIDVYGRYQKSFDESPYKFGAQTSDYLSYGAQANWQVFNRFQNFTNRSKAKAQARIAEYNHEQSELNAQIEVRQYHNAMRASIEKHKVATETISQAEEEVRLAQERFRVGAGTQLDRINAEVSLASARAEEVQAMCDYLIARAQLWRATGRYSQLGLDQ